jgi:membrane-associated protease RseP (regulator of RpoE activity)
VEPEGSSAIRLVMLVLVVAWVGLAGGLSWLAIIVALVAAIFLHELGHYLTAKWAGMKVTEFFIGFGPRIWSFQRGETEYGIKGIPAGAYVKVIGMTNLEEVAPEDEDRTYRQKPYWRRMSVAVAGSAMHFIIAIAGLYVLLVGYGIATDEERSWSVDALATVEVDGEVVPGPAAEAGVEVGDTIVAVDGDAVDSWSAVRAEVGAREPGELMLLTVERDGEQIELPVELAANEAGAGFLGVGAEVDFVVDEIGVLEGVPMAFQEFGSVAGQSIGALASFFSPAGLADFVGIAADTAANNGDGGSTSVATAAESSENRVLSILGLARLGAQAAEDGFAEFLSIVVLFNIFIGVFNLVPLLPLDGGHVAVATYEKGRELVSRRRERYHADVAKLLPLTYLVVFFLVSVGLVALYLDIASPLDL